MNKEQQRDYVEEILEDKGVLSGPNTECPEIIDDFIATTIESPFIDGLTIRFEIPILEEQEYEENEAKKELLRMIKEEIQDFTSDEDEYFAELGFSAGFTEELDAKVGNKLLENAVLFDKSYDFFDNMF